ncbi:subtilisin-like protein [Anaeromyces robustus]|uniref:Subtilisin-like protein n=1 Tax=Anaeromyces robustus TaxID=1754192 RepID=A0A1Y1XHY6_9FUNG|nr:subtilisin-like protein [Anaeromyces robustus]|eukprot:ORX85353.1 subtilisin-like protein [Anaeromyces robustus]
MRLTNSIFLLLSIITIFLSTIKARNIRKKYTRDSTNGDNYYIIFVNNTLFDIGQNNVKRQDNTIMINSLVNDIHNLIIENKNTYSNIKKLEEIENKDAHLSKRQVQEQYLQDYGDSNLVYPVTTFKDKTILIAYLSPDLVETVKFMPNIIDCVQNRKLKMRSENNYYDENEIKQETQWKNVGIRESLYNHLSLISQGHYSEKLISQYDNNYYYPGSSGEDIDIFIFDSGFNFNHPEFSDKDSRIIKCAFNITQGKVTPSKTDDICLDPNDVYYRYHGSQVADTAAGIKYGSAKRANIYGVIISEIEDINIITGLLYIKNNLFRPHKAIFNFSFGDYYKLNEEDEVIKLYKEVVAEISNLGAVFVAAAGNDSRPSINTRANTIDFPCAFDDVICVGGIDNKYLNVTFLGNRPTMYRKAMYSNYGSVVNVYAPGYIMVGYQDANHVNQEIVTYGNSLSSPLVAGVIATIMSEYPEIQFTTKSMLDYLNRIGEKNIIQYVPDENPTLFINNGKHIVYSEDNKYMGCGIYSGNQKCNCKIFSKINI